MRIFFCLFAFLVTATTYAQYEKGLKFGRIEAADLTLTEVPGHPTAEAYVLYDKLDLRFDYTDDGPQTVETFHRRMKLLKPAGFDRADVTLTYDRSYEDIGGLKAAIYLPNGEEIKLKNRDLVRQDLEGDGRSISFTFPQVTEGAIVEYTYTRRSQSLLLPSQYTFQEAIPVRWAEYTAEIPEYYKYVSLGQQGDYFIRDVGMQNRQWRVSRQSAAAKVNTIQFQDLRYVMKDISPFRLQPYTNNLQDYLPRVKLQLQSVEYPNTISQPVFNNWITTVRELHERQDFGRYYQVKGNYNAVYRVAEPIIMAGKTDKERIDAAYHFVASRIDWNGRYSFLGSDSPDKVFANGSGNSADLNLCLLALLNEAGIPARPLLVSLRDRGAHVEMYPLINQFNHLMVYTEVDGAPYLLDANGTDRPPGLPRVAALNHRGWVADEQNPQWINVEVPRAKRVIMADITVAADGRADVDLTGRMDSYYAFSGRHQLDEMKQQTEAPLAAEVVARFPEAKVTATELVSGKDSSEPLTYRTRFELPAGMAADDYLYIQPILTTILDDELDDVDTRQYPIDFPYPWREQYVATVHLPEGYVLEEAPGSIRMRSEDGGITATYTTNLQPGRTLIVNFQVDLDRTFYRAEDYTALRDMYRRIIELQEGMLVLKRAK